MDEKDEKLIDELTDSMYHCVDFLNLITEQQDLNRNISSYIGPLKILKRELNNNLYYIQQLIK